MIQMLQHMTFLTKCAFLLMLWNVYVIKVTSELVFYGCVLVLK